MKSHKCQTSDKSRAANSRTGPHYNGLSWNIDDGLYLIGVVMCWLYSSALAVDHRVCFRSLNAAEFHRHQSQVAVAAAAAAAVAGFSAFSLHPSALDAATDRRYYVAPHGASSSMPTQRNSLASCCRVTGDDVGQVRGVLPHWCSPGVSTVTEQQRQWLCAPSDLFTCRQLTVRC